MDADQILADLISATDRLLENIDGLPDSAARAPSLLPGWSRGHVLTHLARNAEGGTRLLSWARTGVPSYEYQSMDARAAAIEAGSGRPARVLIDDVRRTAAAFAGAAADMPPEAWQRVVRYTGGQEPRADVIVPSRWAEVLIHHVDLDVGFGPREWPRRFVEEMLRRTAAGLRARDGVPPVRLAGAGRSFSIGSGPPDITVTGPEADLLAWLLGRSDGRSLAPDPDGALPALPAIY